MKTNLILVLAFFIVFWGCESDDDTVKMDCEEIEQGTGDFCRITAHSDVDLVSSERRVRILVRVADSMNVGKQGLTIDDFIILENCENKVNDKESEANIDPRTIPSKIQTTLLLDVSFSLEGMVDQIKEAALELISNKVENQEFAIYTFDSKVTILQDYTSDISLLTDAINSVPTDSLDKSTNLYQAILDASDNCNNEIGIEEIINGSIIVFTDGKHNADPNLTINDVLESTRDKNVYVAALKGDNLDELSLKQIAGNTSNYLYIEDIGTLKDSFLGILDMVKNESQSTYFLNYVSPISVDGNQHLRVMIKNNSNIGEDSYIDKTFSTNGF